MKLLTAILVAALLAPATVFASTFEGTVTMQMSSGRGETTPMTFSIRSGISRIDISARGHDVGMILDQNKNQMTMLLPERSMYLVRPLPMANSSTPQSAMSNDVQVEKTNEHEKILGYDTTKYVAKTKDGTTEAWVTDQLGTFLGLGNAGGGPMGGRPNGPAHMLWQDAFRGKDAFPLRVTTTNAQGKQTFRMEATSIEKKSLPDSLFTPPAGYQKLDMENMMRGMPGMQGMPGAMRPPPSGG